LMTDEWLWSRRLSKFSVKYFWIKFCIDSTSVLFHLGPVVSQCS
jgi:hypothetical protein